MPSGRSIRPIAPDVDNHDKNRITYAKERGAKMERRAYERTPERMGLAATGCIFLLAAVWGIACSSNKEQPQTGADAAATTGMGGSEGSPGGGNPVAEASTGAGTGDAEAASSSDSAVSNADAAEEPLGPPPPDPVIPLTNGTLRLEVWGQRTIRVLYDLKAPAPGPSLAVTQARPLTQFTVSDTTSQLVIATRQLRAQVDKSTGQVTFLAPSGAAIFSESASNPHQLAPATGGVGPYVSTGTFTPNAGDMCTTPDPSSAETKSSATMISCSPSGYGTQSSGRL